MGLFFNRKSAEEREEEYYAELYEEFHGKKPNRKLTDAEKWELDDFEEDEWEEDEQ